MSEYIQSAILVMSYNLALLAGCAYLVVSHEWSAWWFVLAYFLRAGLDEGDKDKKSEAA